MPEHEDTTSILNGQDIVFDCKYCGKNLVIDSRGAGLMIQCPECQAELEVRIPEEGVATEETTAAEMAPEGAGALEGEYTEAHIREMITELEELRFRRQFLERKHAEYAMCLRAIGQQMTVIRRAVDQIDELLLNMSESPAKDTQKIRKV